MGGYALRSFTLKYIEAKMERLVLEALVLGAELDAPISLVDISLFCGQELNTWELQRLYFSAPKAWHLGECDAGGVDLQMVAWAYLALVSTYICVHVSKKGTPKTYILGRVPYATIDEFLPFNPNLKDQKTVDAAIVETSLMPRLYCFSHDQFNESTAGDSNES